MKAKDVAVWFLNKNPNLYYGFNDENTKLNKLVFFTNMMYYSVYGENLIDEPFKKWDNGPVCTDIYRAYRYGDLATSTTIKSDIKDKYAIEVLNIVNFVYSYLTGYELSQESHKISIWNDASHNDYLDFKRLKNEEIKKMKILYDLNKDLDFENMGMEKINDNIYYYDKNNIKIDDAIVEKLSCIQRMENRVVFLEMIDGELVFNWWIL